MTLHDITNLVRQRKRRKLGLGKFVVRTAEMDQTLSRPLPQTFIASALKSETSSAMPSGGSVDAALCAVESLVNYEFKDKSLLRQALTHKSLGDHCSNQKLEWLGDSVLQLVVSHVLYDNLAEHPEIQEGELTSTRTLFVRGETLRWIAQKWNLSRFLITAKGVSDVFVDKMEEDLVESIIGAVFLDSSYDAVKEVISRMFDQRDLLRELSQIADNKSALQTYIASLQVGGAPIYREIGRTGPANNIEFTVEVTYEHLTGIGTGTSKLRAEQAAAGQLLSELRRAGATLVPTTAKKDLLERCHHLKIQLPEFVTVAAVEKQHDSTCTATGAGATCRCPSASFFCCTCTVVARDQRCQTVGRSANKKGAEKIASHLMLQTLQGIDNPQLQILPCTEQEIVVLPKQHPKSMLTAISQKERHAPPVFEIREIPAKFEARCVYPAFAIELSNTARSKKEAERAAAAEMLELVFAKLAS